MRLIWVDKQQFVFVKCVMFPVNMDVQRTVECKYKLNVTVDMQLTEDTAFHGGHKLKLVDFGITRIECIRHGLLPPGSLLYRYYITHFPYLQVVSAV